MVGLLLFLTVQGVAVILVGLAALFFSFEPAWPAAALHADLARPGDARSGSLLLKTEEAVTPMRRGSASTSILTVSGPTVRARVTQIFRNPTQDWVEAIYVYPLPAGGAVDTLKMVIGDRVVVGEIKERQQARIIYEQAQRERTEGGADRAGAAEHLHQLGRQYRPRRNRAGADRISGAGAAIRQRILAAGADGGRSALQSGADRAERRPQARTAAAGARRRPIPCRIANRISPEVLDPAENAPVNPTAITVRLQAGFPLGEVKSHHHQVKIESPDSATRIIQLADGPVPADRDFELTWKPAAEKAPSVGLFRERVGDADYLLAFVTPPSLEAAEQKPLPREVDLRDRQFRLDGRHLDRPGQGEPDLRARPAAAGRPLQRDPLRSHHGRAVPGPVPADAERIRPGHRASSARCRRGRHRDGAGDARGADRRQAADGANYVRQVVFLTDGAIGNEQQLFDTIAAHARALARVHGRHRLGAEYLPDDPRRRTRPRHLHPYRLGRTGRGAHARACSPSWKTPR